MQSVLPWAWLTIGWCAIALGAWMLAVGRFTTRRHGARRCRRCGYDMAGLPSTTCPECGRVAKDERELATRATLRRWRPIGAALLLLGWLGTQYPAMASHGWAGAVPNWTLAWLAPAEPATPLPLGNSWGPSRPREKGFTRLRNDLCREASRRLADGELSGPLAGAYLRRQCAGVEEAMVKTTNLPAAWPWNVSFPGRTIAHGGLSVHVDLLPPDRPASTAALRATVSIRGKRYTVGATTAAIDMTRGRDDFMEHVSGRRLDADVAAAVGPTLIITGERASVRVQQRRSTPQWAAVDCFLCYSVRVLLDGRSLGEGWCLARRAGEHERGWFDASVKWEGGGQFQAALRPQDVEIELVGEPGCSTEQYLAFPWEGPATAWAGTVRVRPVIERKP